MADGLLTCLLAPFLAKATRQLPSSPTPRLYLIIISKCLPAVAEGKNAIDYVAFMAALRTGLITYVPVNRQAVSHSAGNCLVLPPGACARQRSMLFMVSNLQQHIGKHVVTLLECSPPAEH